MNFRIEKDFAKLWAGQTISEIGSRISREGIPLAALLTLNAGAAQMGILSAIGSASVLLFSLGAGVVVDRLRKRPVMIAADVGRAGLLLLVPFAFLMHWLSMTVLIAISAVTGILTVLFDVSYQTYLPVLVAPRDLLESNRRLSISGSTAEMLGPAIAGILIRAITAPIAIAIDAVSFLVSALSILSIRKNEPAPQIRPQVSLFSEALEGARFIWAHPALRALLLRSATSFLFMGLFFTLYMLNAIRILHLTTSALGITIALGGAGSLAGAFAAVHLPKRIGLGPTFFTSAILIGFAQALIPLSAQFPQIGLECLCLQQFGGDMAWTIYMINETTLRQSLTPEHVLGRVNGAMQLASRGMLPFGALAGGFMAERFGVPATLWVAAIGVLLSCLWLIPLRNTQEIHTASVHG